MSISKQSIVSLAYWNIDSLFNRIDGQRSCKLGEDIFCELANHYDIIGLVETHCGPDEPLVLEGFQIYQNNRTQSANSRYFGGIAVCINNSIKPGVKILPTSNSEMMWLKLCQHFFNLDRDLYISMVYISPHGSSYTGKRDNIFEILENDVSVYSKLGNCLISGDFNARTAKEPDFCNDDNVRYIGVPSDYVCDSALARNNMDPHCIDEHGKELLSLCKTSGLRILNGRTVGDTLGCCTCYSPNGVPSVIDYMLASASLLSNIEYFHVNPPSDLSIHCMLSTAITATFTYNQQESYSLKPLPSKYLWDNLSAFKYKEAMNTTEMQSTIKTFLNTSHIMSVNQTVEKINEIMKNAAKLANINVKLNRPNKRKNCRKKRKWFNNDCEAMRSELRKIGKQLHKEPYNTPKRHYYHLLRRKYKQLVNKSKSEFRGGILHQLENLNDSDPQAFWKLYDQLIDLDKQDRLNPIPAQEWVQHFTNVFSSTNHQHQLNAQDSMEDFINQNVDGVFNELNFHITEEEISKAIGGLKSGKASGLDQISNEMLKASSTALIPVLNILFNQILTRSSFPDSWRYNTLTPLHKKGDPHIPDNYRGIALSSNLCKLFCSVMHNRLTKFADLNKLIPPNQIGYRKFARTADHVLTLKTLIDKTINKICRERLFACFVDFKSAFDTVSREALLFKLLKANIGGNFLKTLRSMYENVFFHVKLTSGITEPFSSNSGVKQGCVLSPLLFNLFIRDLPDIFDSDCDPTELNGTDLSCLMFADDLVLLSKSARGLQTCLERLYHYCSKWSLKVNLSKTKVIIFNKAGKLLSNFHFFYNHQEIEITRKYCYLGIVFNCAGTFADAIERLTDQGRKALFKLQQKRLQNHVTTALKLFEVLIVPILSYCSEVWAPLYSSKFSPDNLFQSCDKIPIEKLHNKFCRYLLGVHRKSSNAAVRAELGRRPLILDLLARSAKYWLVMSAANNNSLANIAYNDLLFQTSNNINLKSPNWAESIKNMWTLCNLNGVWENHGTKYKHKTLRLLKTSLYQIYDNSWWSLINNDDSKLRTYKTFKFHPSLENYILEVPDVQKRKEFTKLRISSHQLQIELGRYTKPRKTPVENRICKLCNSQEVETEQHFFMSCPLYNSARKSLFENLASFTAFRTLNSTDQFRFIMSCLDGDTEIITLVTNFVNKCIEIRLEALATI